MATIDGDIYERLLPLIADHFDVSENDPKGTTTGRLGSKEQSQKMEEARYDSCSCRESTERKNKIELDTNVLTEFGADFTALVEFTSKIEERFGIRVPDSDACKLETVQEMVLYISKKRA